MSIEHGPIPVRSEERRRVNKPVEGVEIEKIDLTDLIQHPVEVPVADDDWHPMVKALWESIRSSGQSVHYEPSDWMVAMIICESLSRELKPQFVGFEHRFNKDAGEMEDRARFETIPIKGGNLSSILKAFHVLMLTEGDRRRMRLELSRQGADDGVKAPVVPIGQQRARLLG